LKAAEKDKDMQERQKDKDRETEIERLRFEVEERTKQRELRNVPLFCGNQTTKHIVFPKISAEGYLDRKLVLSCELG